MIPPLYPYVSFGFSDKEIENSFFLDSGRSSFALIAKVLKYRHDNLIFIIPAYTCSSVIDALRYVGVNYTFVDLNEKLQFDELDLIDIIEANDDKKVVLVPTSLFGVELINYKIKFPDCIVIEDKSQSFPYLQINDADYQFFSFGRGKMVSSWSGGAVVTLDKDFATLYKDLEMKNDFLKSYIFVFLQKFVSKYMWSFVSYLINVNDESVELEKVPKESFIKRISNIKKSWIVYSIEQTNMKQREETSNYYIRDIRKENLFDLDENIPYLRLPIKKSVIGDGVSFLRYKDTLSEAIRVRKNRAFIIPSILAEQCSMVPTHDLVNKKIAQKLVKEINQL